MNFPIFANKNISILIKNQEHMDILIKHFQLNDIEDGYFERVTKERPINTFRYCLDFDEAGEIHEKGWLYSNGYSESNDEYIKEHSYVEYESIFSVPGFSFQLEFGFVE